MFCIRLKARLRDVGSKIPSFQPKVPGYWAALLGLRIWGYAPWSWLGLVISGLVPGFQHLGLGSRGGGIPFETLWGPGFEVLGIDFKLWL